MKCFHNIIRLRKRNYRCAHDYEVVVMSTKVKATSKKVVEKLGYVRLRKTKNISINFQRLGYYLNAGVKIHYSVERYLVDFCY